MSNTIENDTLHRFLLENTQVRGEWIHLEQAWQQIRACRDYPSAVENVLGEATAAICLLAATLKYEGSLILQINSIGPIEMLVVQATSDGEIRGLAKFDQTAFDETGSLMQNLSPKLSELFGDGQIVISLVNDEASPVNDRYQGIVSLEGETLSECLQTYFQQSEQLQTRLYLASNPTTAAGLLLQRLPNSTQTSDDYVDNDIEDWHHATALTDTISSEELLTLDKGQLLHRLFHEDDVRLFDGKPICFQCTCSTLKIENAIRSLGRTEADDIIKEQGSIEIRCEFCNKQYALDAIDIERLFDDNIRPPNASIH